MIPFYYIEKPCGSNDYFVFSSVKEVSPKSYHGSKKLCLKICKNLNNIYNKEYNKLEQKPTLTIKTSTPKFVTDDILGYK